MRMYTTFLAGALGLALASGAAEAQTATSWGPKHTTYWSSESTGTYEPGKFMDSGMPAMSQPSATPTRVETRPQRMYYQAPGKRVRAPMRPRQRQPGTRPGQPPADQGTQAPPAERGQQPPADAKPSAPPAQGQPPAQTTPK